MVDWNEYKTITGKTYRNSSGSGLWVCEKRDDRNESYAGKSKMEFVYVGMAD